VDIVACPRCATKNRVPAAAPGSPRCGRCHGPLPWIAEAGDASFAAVAEAAVVPVLVDLWAPWCGPCRAVSPALERLAGAFAGRMKLVKVNIDEAPQLSARFDVRGIPTLLVLRDGQVVARRTGADPEPVLAGWLEGLLDPAPA
jgi:thioredoxin 2